AGGETNLHRGFEPEHVDLDVVDHHPYAGVAGRQWPGQRLGHLVGGGGDGSWAGGGRWLLGVPGTSVRAWLRHVLGGTWFPPRGGFGGAGRFGEVRRRLGGRG